MQESGQPSPLQLLFVELRVGLARSAIQSALLLNGGAAVALLLLLSNIYDVSGGRPALAETHAHEMGIAIFALGLFIAAMTFVNA